MLARKSELALMSFKGSNSPVIPQDLSTLLHHCTGPDCSSVLEGEKIQSSWGGKGCLKIKTAHPFVECNCLNQQEVLHISLIERKCPRTAKLDLVLRRKYAKKSVSMPIWKIRADVSYGCTLSSIFKVSTRSSRKCFLSQPISKTQGGCVHF